jgi:hypothetical protein
MEYHTVLLRRIRAEFLEMPGLGLTLDQAYRLCGVERNLCKTLLDALVDEKFLRVRLDGRYARVSDGSARRPHPAKSDRRASQPSLKAS